ncbi:MAG TPA: BON domain-containing protein [Verrucomicrobiae bacterium]|nr:BON domain-containing protein [Verrucomicrobiae bacterium]
MNTDSRLRETLVAQLSFWVGRSANNIQVVVNDGIVTLRGRLPGYEQKIFSVETAQRVAGVKAVTDELVVELKEARKRTDPEIAASARNAIGWTTTVPSDSIKITARAGMLTLEGTVENWSQKGAVERSVRHLPGIIAIANLITIKPQPFQRDVKAAIESSFKKHPRFDARKIDVETTGSKVVLRGNTSSIAEREEAECAARTVKGVSDVENRIVIADSATG